MNFINIDVSPEKWINLLTQVNPKRSGQLQDHQYILIKSNEYLVDDFSKSAGTKKLSVADISRISLQMTKRLSDEYGQQPLTTKKIEEFKEKAEKIKNDTQSIIAAKEAKANPFKRIIKAIIKIITFGRFTFKYQIEKQEANELAILQQKKLHQDLLLENILINKKPEERDSVRRVINFLLNENFSIEVITEILDLNEGDIFNWVIRLKDSLDDKAKIEETNTEMSNLIKYAIDSNAKANIPVLNTFLTHITQIKDAYDLDFKTANDLILLTRKYDLSPESANNLIDLQKTFIESSLVSLRSQNTAKILEGIIKDYFQEAVDVYQTSQIVEQFQKDIPRGQTFIRKDIDRLENVLDDKMPLPLSNSKNPSQETDMTNEIGKKRLEQAQAAIKEIVNLNHQENQQWEPILQVAVTQTTLNAAFMVAIGELLSQGVKIKWVENGVDYYLLPELPEGLPPIQIEVIRDFSSQNIIKVKVTMQGQLDLIKAHSNNDKGENSKTLFPKALEAKFTYFVTLDEKNNPTISDLTAEYETSLMKI